MGQRYNLFYINKLFNRIIYKVINKIYVKKPIFLNKKSYFPNFPLWEYWEDWEDWEDLKLK